MNKVSNVLGTLDENSDSRIHGRVEQIFFLRTHTKGEKQSTKTVRGS